MGGDDLIVVRTFSNIFDAEVAKSALDAVDLESLIRSDDAGGLQPGLWPARGVHLVIREADRDRAEELLGQK